MIVSWNWLTEYVRLDMPVGALSDRLALTGLNHESTTDVGQDLAIDLEVTSNRSDCLGHLGVAREIAVLYGHTLRVPDPRPKETGTPVETKTALAIEDFDLCPRFTSRVITGAKVKESPWWLRKRLETLGVRPISNIVDITNYVMFECGQPLHAYDLDKLAGQRLVVRRARAGETLKAINGRTYELSPEMLVIADAERPVGLAGVMGGLDSEIGEGSTNVLIESAQFDSMSIRRTARSLGLHSPASYRFERPLDPERTEWASRRCAQLILELAGGTLHAGVLDLGKTRAVRPVVSLRFAQIARVLGISVPPERVIAILDNLGLERVDSTETGVSYRPPSWRNDLDREIDLIEEVARIHGYEHIPENRAVPLTSSLRAPRERVESEIRNALTACGFDEAVTFSLVSDSLAAPVSAAAPLEPIHVDHSSRRRENALRQSLIPSLLAARRHNEAHGNTDLDLFEIANVYLPRAGGGLPEEPTKLAIAGSHDYFGLKGVIEALLGRLHAERGLEAHPVNVAPFAAGRAAELRLNGHHLGYVGELDRKALDAMELRGSCSAAELAFDRLIADANLVPTHVALPPFPAVTRDLSLVVSHALPWADLAGAVRKTAGATLESVVYLDTFRGGNLAEDQQSIHFGMKFRHPERTLTGDEVERAVKAVVDDCAARFGATLRT